MDAGRNDITVVKETGQDAEDRNKIEMENPLWRPLTRKNRTKKKVVDW